MNTPPPNDAVELPELTTERLDVMERVVLGRIAAARSARRRRRGRLWAGGAAAAAVVVIAAVIAPGLTTQFSSGGSASSTVAEDAPAVEPLPGGGQIIVPEEGDARPGSAGGSSGSSGSSLGGETDNGDATDAREITANGSSTLVVDDVADAAQRIAADAESRGGYVESLSLSDDGASAADPSGGSSVSEIYPAPAPPGGGWVSVRVPADELTAMMSGLADLGEVTSSNISRQDVTDEAVDLRARVAASEASVARLTELIAQAGSLADLIEAESALAERQATLDADRRQLEQLENRVALSTLSVQLAPRSETVEADPAGFGDGLGAGWNGLVTTLNGLVIAFGFLLPWLLIGAAATAAVWGIRRLVRRRARGGEGA